MNTDTQTRKQKAQEHFTDRKTVESGKFLLSQTRTEKSVNWHKAFCPVCQPIVDGHFIKREAAFVVAQEADDELIRRYKQTNQALQTHADKLAEALRDIETRAGYALIRPDKTNNDIQMDYIKQKAQAALAAYEESL